MRKNGDAAHGIVGVVVRKGRPGDEKRFANCQRVFSPKMVPNPFKN